MINHESFTPRPEWDNFERMIEIMLDMPLALLEQLAELPGEVGEYNSERLLWWTNVWNRYCKVTGRNANIN